MPKVTQPRLDPFSACFRAKIDWICSQEIRKKLVVVGDGSCGKTSLLIVYQGGAFPEVGYFPNRFRLSPLAMAMSTSHRPLTTTSPICFFDLLPPVPSDIYRNTCPRYLRIT